MKTGTLLAVIVLALAAIAHMLRLVSGTEVVIGGSEVPQWVSGIGVIVPGIVAWLLWKESK